VLGGSELAQYGLIICKHLFFYMEKFVDLRGHLFDLEHFTAYRVLLVEFISEFRELTHDLKEFSLGLSVLKGESVEFEPLFFELTVEREGVTVYRRDQDIFIDFSLRAWTFIFFLSNFFIFINLI
jgi:hypothetical protein